MSEENVYAVKVSDLPKASEAAAEDLLILTKKLSENHYESEQITYSAISADITVGVVKKLDIIGEDFAGAKKVTTIDGILDDNNADALVTGAGGKSLYRAIIDKSGEI